VLMRFWIKQRGIIEKMCADDHNLTENVTNVKLCVNLKTFDDANKQCQPVNGDQLCILLF
jgi:hypothetical protein